MSYYEQKGITIYNGDCLEVMKQLKDNSIDMILCDLPYGITNCKWDSKISLNLLWEQYTRIIKNNRAIVLTCSQPFTSELVMSNIGMFKYEWIWDKGCGSNFATTKYQPFKEHENILIFSKGKALYNPQRIPRSEYSLLCHPKGKERFMKATKPTETNKIKKVTGKLQSDGLRSPKTIISIKLQRGRMKNMFYHPTQKPILLFEYFIKTYSNENDLILDNCSGSGTTAVACKNLNRNCILIEKDSHYCNVSVNRISQSLF